MCDTNVTDAGSLNIGGYSSTLWNAGSAGLSAFSSLGRGIAQMNTNAATNASLGANYNSQMGLLQTQQTQQNNLASQEQSKIARQAMEERARMVTAAGEAGVSGNSVGSLNNAIDQNANFLATNIETNRSNQQAQTYAHGQALRADATSRMKDESFDWFGTGLQIGADALKFGSTLTKQKVG